MDVYIFTLQLYVQVDRSHCFIDHRVLKHVELGRVE